MDLTWVGYKVEAGELVPFLLKVTLEALLALLQFCVHYLRVVDDWRVRLLLSCLQLFIIGCRRKQCSDWLNW